ncbi:MAG TPA: hypothetical protein VLG50_05760 [Candidatus Saccharimonadales bacterium]|nr:hypothetical protein [Candidatus Saccharimonadales bacterium]
MEQHKQLLLQEAQLKRELQTINENRIRLEKTPAFKDAKIASLEDEVIQLKKKLEPYERLEAQKRIDDYGNQKCTNRHNCTCRSCRDL